MKSQQINRVDLSLDDIIKMDGLDQPQDQNRGNNNRGQNNQRNKGQGQKGFQSSGQQGGRGQGVSGISPLNSHRGPGANTMTNRGQMTAGGGQRTNGGVWSMKRGGGGGQWRGPTSSGGNNNMRRQMNNQQFNSSTGGNNNNNMRRQMNNQQFNSSAGGNNNNNMRRQTNNQQFNSSRLHHTTQGNNPLYNRGLRGNQLQGSLQNRGKLTSVGGARQGPGGMRGGITSNHRQGGIGQGHSQGGGGIGQGTLRIRVESTGLQGVRSQGQTQQGLKQMSFEEKRRMAMQALREARKTIAQLDQQAARETVVNTRRGLLPQPSAGVSSPDLSYQNTADDRYSSNLSLTSDSSHSSSSSEHQLQGRQITSFNITSPASSMQGQKRWQQKSLEGDHHDSTLTISIDNSAPFVSHSDLMPTPVTHRSPSPQSTRSAPPQGARPWAQQPQERRQPHQQQQPNSRHAHSRQHYQQPVSNSRHGDSQPQWQLPSQEQGVERTANSPNLRRGASVSFSRQLAQLKPTVAMKYVFQKKTFSAASTPVSLNDRFSEPAADDPAGRKVFM